MICLSSLADEQASLVLDTSVIINLHASVHGEAIMRTIPNRLVVPTLVFQDLDHVTSKANGEYDFVHDMERLGQVERLDLDDEGWDLFEKLATARGSLGDGETSVIAMAYSLGCVPVLDDAKARRQAQRLVAKPCRWSLDLFLHPGVQAALSDPQLAEAIYLALQRGRMRIADEHCDAVVGLIGKQRAIACTSLPGYKHRVTSWMA